MPGWHERTLELQKQGRIRMVGIIQEQHPERARLFMQWKKMDWPVLVDSLDLLEVTYVPITLLIDEHGVVRKVVSPRVDPLEALEGFVGREFDAPESLAPVAPGPPDPDELGRSIDPTEAQDWRELGRARFLWQAPSRLDKPYPFYDWVDEARREIENRGEEPAELKVEPRGAELTRPSKNFTGAAAVERDLERDDRIQRDPGKYIRTRTVVVPDTTASGVSARVHVELFPRPDADAHWNNEVGGLIFWVDPPPDWKVDRRRTELDSPVARLGPASEEVRRVEFEVQGPESGDDEAVLPAYALYYVCEGIDGACLYRRQDIEIRVDVGAR